jgi:microcystin-dependent protein
VTANFTILTSRVQAETRRALLDLDRRIAPEPPGVIKMFAGATAPEGYLLCTGGTANRFTQADLFAAIGTTWGVGDGSTTFGLPDLRDRLPIGAGATHSLAATGGSKDAVNVSHGHADTFATGNQSANHTHTTNLTHGHADTFATNTTGSGHGHTVLDTRSVWTQRGSGGANALSITTGSQAGSFQTQPLVGNDGTHTHGITGAVTNLPTTNRASGDQSASHNHAITGAVTDSGVSGTDKNLPPYAALHYIIKT